MNQSQTPSQVAYSVTTCPRYRHGSAQLEFVMCLPFLLALFAMTASVGLTSLGKAGTAIDARKEVWQSRATPNQPKSDVKDFEFRRSSAFSMLEVNDELAGLLYGVKEDEVKIFSWVGDSMKPRSRAAIVTQTWDHKHDNVFSQTGPHFALVERMVGQQGNFSQSAVNALSKILSLRTVRFSNANEIQDAEGEVQAANERKKQADAKLKEDMDKIKGNITRLEGDLKRFNADRRREFGDQTRKERRLAELTKETKDLNPIPQDKLTEMNRLTTEIAAHKTEVKRLDGEIKRVEGELYVERRTLANYEKQVRRMESEQNKTTQGNVDERLQEELKHRESLE